MIKRDEVFDEIYQAIVDRLDDEDVYGASVLSYISSYKFDEFPIIVLNQIDYRLGGETLSKTEKKHSFTIESQVFAIDKDGVDSRTIANFLSDLVEDVIQNDFGLRLDMSDVIPNVTENVYRVVQRFSGIIDDDSKIIYRE